MWHIREAIRRLDRGEGHRMSLDEFRQFLNDETGWSLEEMK